MAERVCPVWVGYFLVSPLRKLMENPEKILNPYVTEGMFVADIGCAMGFYSLPLARMVGPGGKVLCVDLQEKMLRVLMKRARKAGLQERIIPVTCDQQSLGLSAYKEKIDFACAIAIVHEVPDPGNFFEDLSSLLKPGGKLLLSEPRGHVSKSGIEQTLSLTEKNRLVLLDRPPIRSSYSFVLEKQVVAT